MLFLIIALCGSALIVRSDKADPTEPVDLNEEKEATEADKEEATDDVAPVKKLNDEWCCCDNKKVSEEEELVCLTADGHRTLLEVEDDHAEESTDGYSIPAQDVIVRSCVGGEESKSPQPCEENCETTSYVTFKQLDSKDTFDRDYSLPTAKWAAAGYTSKYYSDAKQGHKHVLNKQSGNIYAKVDDAKVSKYGLAKAEAKFCLRYETYAYWKFNEVDSDDRFYERGYKAMKNARNPWTCVEKKKCVRYLAVEDPCGSKNIIRGNGPEVNFAEDMQVGGELYKLRGRQGQCEKPASKDGWMSSAWSSIKKTTGTTGAGSECPEDMFHSSKGPESSPSIPYRFCDCKGECK